MNTSALDMFPRFGGGIGLTRLEPAFENSTLLDEMASKPIPKIKQPQISY